MAEKTFTKRLFVLPLAEKGNRMVAKRCLFLPPSMSTAISTTKTSQTRPRQGHNTTLVLHINVQQNQVAECTLDNALTKYVFWHNFEHWNIHWPRKVPSP